MFILYTFSGSQVTVFHRRNFFVPFEVSAQIRLVGEVQFVGNFLNAEVGGLQQHFYFQNDEIINHFLCRLAGDASANSRQVLGGDAEPVGIEVHFALGDAVVMYEYHKAFEQFVLAVLSFYLLPGEVALTLIVNIH